MAKPVRNTTPTPASRDDSPLSPLSPHDPRTPGRPAYGLPALLLAAFTANAIYAAVQNSAVADEVGGHLAAGYLYWKTGVYSGGIANFPLAHLLIALPVVLAGQTYELFTEQHLLLFRLPVIALALLLGVAIYRLAAGLFDRKAALCALGLFAFSPNLLAHGSLATLDLPITCFWFLTIWMLWRFDRRPSWLRMLALSLALTAALTTKVQAILLTPLIAIVLLDRGMRFWRGNDRTALKFSAWPLLLVVPWLGINLIYLNAPFITGPWLPSAFLEAVQFKLLHARDAAGLDQVAYLCGQYSRDGWWYYFPFAILVKTPLVTLVLAALGVLLFRPSREVALFVLLPATLFLGAAMASSLNIGLRHVLPVFPFILLLAGRGATVLTHGKARVGVLAALGALYIGQALWITPHQLSYFNLAAGGATNGHRLLIDSNYDWGQNDRFLRRYLQHVAGDYVINPDAFHPTTGRIFVNANALRGVYNHGGPDAYTWLRGFQPVNQIAYTWFEYDLPASVLAQLRQNHMPPGDRGVARNTTWYPWNLGVPVAERRRELQTIAAHLCALEQRYGSIPTPQFHIDLAWAFVATGCYGDVLDESRTLVAKHPQSQYVLGLGAETMVRWKLGILNFGPHEYLTGPQNACHDQPAAPPDVEQVVTAARRLGITAPLNELHLNLAQLLNQHGQRDRAIEQYKLAERVATPAPNPPR